MDHDDDARNLLFGVLALQRGLIEQAQLLAAFETWCRARHRSMADIMGGMGLIDGRGRIKLSPGKKTYPLGKQIYRVRDPLGRFSLDHVTRFDEKADGEPLLIPVIRDGGLIAPLPRLDAIRERCRRQRADLPDFLRGVDAEPKYPLSYSDVLEAEAMRLGVK